jgi:putative redox protein
MTLRLYADRKGWPLERVTVRLTQQRVHARDCEECEDKSDTYAHRIERQLTIHGDLTDEQRARLLDIAHKCPVHRTLTSEIVVADVD